MHQNEGLTPEYKAYLSGIITSELPSIVREMTWDAYDVQPKSFVSQEMYRVAAALAKNRYVADLKNLAVLDTVYQTRTQAPEVFLSAVERLNKTNGERSLAGTLQAGYYLRTGNIDEAQYMLDWALDYADLAGKTPDERTKSQQTILASYASAALSLQQRDEVLYALRKYEQLPSHSNSSARGMLDLALDTIDDPELHEKALAFMNPALANLFHMANINRLLKADASTMDEIANEIASIGIVGHQMMMYALSARHEFLQNRNESAQVYLTRSLRLLEQIRNEKSEVERMSCLGLLAHMFSEHRPEIAKQLHQTALDELYDITDFPELSRQYKLLFDALAENENSKGDGGLIEELLKKTLDHALHRFGESDHPKWHRTYLMSVFPYNREPAYQTLEMLQQDVAKTIDSKLVAVNYQHTVQLVDRMATVTIQQGDVEASESLISILSGLEVKIEGFLALYSQFKSTVGDYDQADSLRRRLVAVMAKSGNGNIERTLRSITTPQERVEALWQIHTVLTEA